MFNKIKSIKKIKFLVSVAQAREKLLVNLIQNNLLYRENLNIENLLESDFLLNLFVIFKEIKFLYCLLIRKFGYCDFDLLIKIDKDSKNVHNLNEFKEFIQNYKI